MDSSIAGREVHQANYVFQVVTKVEGLYVPVSIVSEMPLGKDFWLGKSKQQVAQCTGRILSFLLRVDPAARCRLEAEKASVKAMRYQRRFWFRDEETDISKGPETSSDRIRAWQDLKRTANPYTTYGILECLGETFPEEMKRDEIVLRTLPFWAGNSLTAVTPYDSDFTIVVFDITDLDHVSWTVIDMPPGSKIRRMATMLEHCATEFKDYDIYEREVVHRLGNVPCIEDEDILQLVWTTKDLKYWAKYEGQIQKRATREQSRARKALKRYKNALDFNSTVLARFFPHDCNLESYFEFQVSNITNDEVAGKIMSWLFRGNLSLVAVRNLTIGQLLCGLKFQSTSPARCTLSFSAQILIQSTPDQRKELIAALMTQNLETVFIADPPVAPAHTQEFQRLLIQSAEAQARFFGEIRSQKSLWEKVHGTSMWAWKLYPLLEDSMGKQEAGLLKEKVDAFFNQMQKPSIFGI
ncbi:hypothetical protein G3M48_001942 [Beauveria asiatica]|uniref:Uncharacterized protein n=1 Tax=Beauveria asiatica TaxID=1069075 RepID=A0AAW0RZF5_9HYPO